MANIIQGGDLMLFIGNKSIAFATNHTLSINAETTDISHKDLKGSWTDSEVKSFNWEVTTENLYSNDGEGLTYDDLFDKMIAKTKLTGYFGKASQTTEVVPTGGWTNASSGYYTGKVIITSLVKNAPNGDNATFTATLKGCGELSREDGTN